MAPDTYVPTFGDALRSVRRGLGMSQQEVGDLLGVSNGTISNWETGNTHYVSRTTRQELAVALKQRPDYFDGFPFGNQIVESPPAPSPRAIPAAHLLGQPLSSPHNGIGPDRTIKRIHGVEDLSEDVRYVVRSIQYLYDEWLHNPGTTDAHWWFYLAESLLTITSVEEWSWLRTRLVHRLTEATPIHVAGYSTHPERADDV